jgi:hypothetical protein
MIAGSAEYLIEHRREQLIEVRGCFGLRGLGDAGLGLV